MTQWKTGDEIGRRGKLRALLSEIQQQAERESLPYEVVVQEVRREAAERNRRELAALEREERDE